MSVPTRPVSNHHTGVVEGEQPSMSFRLAFDPLRLRLSLSPFNDTLSFEGKLKPRRSPLAALMSEPNSSFSSTQFSSSQFSSTQFSSSYFSSTQFSKSWFSRTFSRPNVTTNVTCIFVNLVFVNLVNCQICKFCHMSIQQTEQ